MEAVLGRFRTVLDLPNWEQFSVAPAPMALQKEAESVAPRLSFSMKSYCLQAEIVANFKGVYKLFQIA